MWRQQCELRLSGVRCPMTGVRCQVSDLSVTVKNVILQCTRVAIKYNCRYHGTKFTAHLIVYISVTLRLSPALPRYPPP